MTDQPLFDQLVNLPLVAKLLGQNANEEVEQVLLGTLLTRRGAFGRTVGRCTSDDFADPIHGAIYDAIADRVSQGRSTDHRLLAELGDTFDADLQDVGGGRAYLAQLAGCAFIVEQIADYADTLRTLATRRRMILAGLRAIAAGHESPKVEEGVAAALAEVEDLVDGGRAKTRAEVITAMVEAMSRPAKVFSTGYPSIDNAWGGGMYAGRMYCVAGKGKAGKTSLAGGISYALNRAGVRHAYFALEMGSDQIEQRQVARDIGTHSMALLGNVRSEVLGRAGVYAASLDEQGLNNVIYTDMPGGTFDRLRTEVLAARYRHRCEGFILDYWQLVGGRSGGISEEEHLRRVAEWLAATCKRLGMWALVLAQLADDDQATAVSRTALNRNADQLYFLRDCDTDGFRWLEGKASRYTPLVDIGAKSEPALKLSYPGPHFEDWAARGTDDDPAAQQAQRDMGEG